MFISFVLMRNITIFEYEQEEGHALLNQVWLKWQWIEKSDEELTSLMSSNVDHFLLMISFSTIIHAVDHIEVNLH